MARNRDHRGGTVIPEAGNDSHGPNKATSGLIPLQLAPFFL